MDTGDSSDDYANTTAIFSYLIYKANLRRFNRRLAFLNFYRILS